MIRLLEQELKRAVKAVWSPAVDAAGVTDRALAPALDDRDRWTLLTYHRITERLDEDPYRSGMSVRAERFRTQLEWLGRHFDVRTVGDGLHAMRSGSVGPRPLLSITFDDGYLDNLRVAAPILRSVGLPASFYVTVGRLDAPPPFWWDRVTHAVRTGARRTPLGSDEIELPGEPRRWSTAPMSRGELVESLLGELWQLPEHALPSAVSAIERALQADPAPGPTLPPRMDRDQVRALHAQGFEIGAHSVDHMNLCLRDPVGMRAEMVESRAELERTLAAPVPGFAYPGGRLDDPVVDCARACGFDYALTTLSGTNRADADPMRLRRVGAPDAGLPDFKRTFAPGARARRAARAARRHLSRPTGGRPGGPPLCCADPAARGRSSRRADRSTAVCRPSPTTPFVPRSLPQAGTLRPRFRHASLTPGPPNRAR